MIVSAPIAVVEATLNLVYFGSAIVILVVEVVVEMYHSFTAQRGSANVGDPYRAKVVLANKVTDVGLVTVFLCT